MFSNPWNQQQDPYMSQVGAMFNPFILQYLQQQYAQNQQVPQEVPYYTMNNSGEGFGSLFYNVLANNNPEMFSGMFGLGGQ